MIKLNLTQRQLSISLIVFSLFTLATTGIIWACADSDETDYSVFAPEYFVSKQYSPFFYTSSEVYYGLQYGDASNVAYNDVIVNEWEDHFSHRLDTGTLKYLLIKATAGGIDSVYNHYLEPSKALPSGSHVIDLNTLDKKEVLNFFSYLKLAKSCESFSVNTDYQGWGYEKIKPFHSPASLELSLLNAFKKEKDDFIKERLWFQLVRYYYFRDDSTNTIKSVQVFDKYKGRFTKNLTYYRALGYVAGHYYKQKNYALSNYLYSLCYNYSYNLKIPSYWSFHPQTEQDWNAALVLAKSKEEKITLWQMLGIANDEGRAIKEIAAIDPKSEKLDLLLSRLINIQETRTNPNGSNDQITDSSKNEKARNLQLVDSIADKNNTSKPWFWNLAAGYLNYQDSNYNAAGKFYAIAKKQFPAGDTMLIAQSKLLDILLYLQKLDKINKQAEQQLTPLLNWLVDLKDNRIVIKNLRFNNALNDCLSRISYLYGKQHDLLKAVCFEDSVSYYRDNRRINNLINLLNKPDKSPFETTMLRFYPHTVNDLYYHQAITLVYNDKTQQAIYLLKKRRFKLKDYELNANPFNSRLNDCHDCDAAAPQKQSFTPLSFVQTLQKMKAAIKAGRNVYRNAYLTAGAYYNISYYGNSRVFYEWDVINDTAAAGWLTSMDVAARYYRLAKKNAVNNEQRARCAFMLSKCAQNDTYPMPDYFLGYYTSAILDTGEVQVKSNKYYHYFDEIIDNYSKTAYYKEVLNECGYFRSYVTGK